MTLIRYLASRCDPLVDELLILVGPILGEAFGIEPRTMQALGAEMMLGLEWRRIVESGDGQVELIGILREHESKRRAAQATERAFRDGRTIIPVGFADPAHFVELGVDECDGYGTCRTLAHAAVAQISFIGLDGRLKPNPAAGAAAAHPDCVTHFA